MDWKRKKTLIESTCRANSDTATWTASMRLPRMTLMQIWPVLVQSQGIKHDLAVWCDWRCCVWGHVQCDLLRQTDLRNTVIGWCCEDFYKSYRIALCDFSSCNYRRWLEYAFTFRTASDRVAVSQSARRGDNLFWWKSLYGCWSAALEPAAGPY